MTLNFTTMHTSIAPLIQSLARIFHRARPAARRRRCHFQFESFKYYSSRRVRIDRRRNKFLARCRHDIRIHNGNRCANRAPPAIHRQREIESLAISMSCAHRRSNAIFASDGGGKFSNFSVVFRRRAGTECTAAV